MSSTIWKFPISLTGEQNVAMPVGARILYIAVQGSAGMQLWAQVDPNAETVMRSIRIFGTGEPMPDNLGSYIGSFQINNGAYVWHAYDGEREITLLEKDQDDVG